MTKPKKVLERISNYYPSRNFLKMKIIPIIKLKSKSSIYSAGFNQKTKIICLPVTSENSVYFYKLGNNKPISIISLNNLKPDIANFIDDEKWIIGCQDSSAPIIITQKKILKTIDIPNKKFFATSIKKSEKGKLFIGNLNGRPIILENESIHEINISIESTYDCVWISEEYLIISCYRNNKIILLKKTGKSSRIIQSIDIAYPYRFSPLINSKIILTARGWKKRPGKVFILQIKYEKEYNLIPKMEIAKEIIIKENYFLWQRILPSIILNKLGYENYTGYINDVAWIDNENFIITTREGNSILSLDVFGNVKNIFRFRKFRPTRFISSRMPENKLILIDAFQARVMEIVKKTL